jgi:hypothetical protein
MTTRKTYAPIAFILVGAAIGFAVLKQTYFVQEFIDGAVLWNSQQATFFIEEGSAGFHQRWVGYPWLVARELLYVPVPSDDDARWLTVVDAGKSGVETHRLKLDSSNPGRNPSFYTPRDGRIYANCPTLGGLCVWSAGSFRPSQVEGKGGAEGLSFLIAHDFQALDGWSKRTFSTAVSDPRMTIDVGDGLKFVVKYANPHKLGEFQIERIDQFGNSTPVFHYEYGQIIVNKSAYDRIFGMD